MPNLEARILALEGGPRRGCLQCELMRLPTDGMEPGSPLRPMPTVCRHSPTTLARDLAGLQRCGVDPSLEARIQAPTADA